MKFEWDAAKAAANRRKHGVSFEEARTALDSQLAITNDDVVHSADENRERTFGLSNRNRVLVVITTRRAQTVRIISARRATSIEVDAYEKEIQKRFGG